MSTTQRLLSVIIPVLILSAIYVSTGPWKSHDQLQYEDLLSVTTQVSLPRYTAIEPEAISRCLQGLPVTVLNLQRLHAGPGITLANPVQKILISIESANAGSLSMIRQRPNRPLPPSSFGALVRCLG